MVIFIKKILALIFCQLKKSFNYQSFSGPMRKHRAQGLWLSYERDLYVPPGGSEEIVVLRAGPDYGPKISVLNKPILSQFVLLRLEALVPFIKNILAKKNTDSCLIIIINMSQMSSAGDYINEILYKNYYARQVLLEKIMIKLKKIVYEYKFNLILLDHKELLGNKNSALFERLFIIK